MVFKSYSDNPCSKADSKYRLTITILSIIFFFGGLLLAPGTHHSYPNTTPFRDLTSNSTSEILEYDFQAEILRNATVLIKFSLTYKVLTGVKTFGFKQFEPPSSISYITNVHVINGETGSPLNHHVTKDGHFVEIGWVFDKEVNAGDTYTVNCSFTFVNAVIDRILDNMLFLPGAAYFRIPVQHNKFTITLPQPVNVKISSRQNFTDIITLENIDSFPVITFDHIITSSYVRISEYISLLALAYLLIISYIEFKKYFSSKKYHDESIQKYPVSVYVRFRFGEEQALWATVFKKALYSEKYFFSLPEEEKAKLLKKRSRRRKKSKQTTNTGNDGENDSNENPETSDDRLWVHKLFTPEILPFNPWNHEKIVFASDYKSYIQVKKRYIEELNNDLYENGFLTEYPLLWASLGVFIFALLGIANKYLSGRITLPVYAFEALLLLLLIKLSNKSPLAYWAQNISKNRNKFLFNLPDREKSMEYIVLFYNSSKSEPPKDIFPLYSNYEWELIKNALMQTESLMKSLIPNIDLKNIFKYAVISGFSSGCSGCAGCSGCSGCGGCGGCGG